MERIERILLLHRMFQSNRFGLGMERMMQLGRCSRATLSRDLEFLRDVLAAPLEHDGKAVRTWRYSPAERVGFELPGVWLTADEMYAVQAAQQVLMRSGAGLLGEAMGRFQARVEKLLGEKKQELGRLRVIRVNARWVDDAVFRIVAEATLRRHQLHCTYKARSNERITTRILSPQRLTHHRDNWYLEAWDEQAEGLRCFALDRITVPALAAERARDLPIAELDAQLAAGYGIFSGPVRGTAVLRFSALVARWVGDECWHTAQNQHYLADGRLERTLPYADPRELLMEVSRYTGQVEVVGPPELRRQMQEMLRDALLLNGCAEMAP